MAHIEWEMTKAHSDAGGWGIKWRCPDCGTSLAWAPSMWWKLECSCPGKDWDLSIVITDGTKS